MVLRRLHQRTGVLGKAGAAKTGTGVQELGADAVVEADAARHFLDVGAGALGEIGDLVDEGDLGGQERIGRVLDQLGGAPARVHDRGLVEIERPIDLRDHLAGALVLGADHDAVGMLEITDRGALAQEFRIGGNHHIGVRIGLGDDAFDIVAGADGHRRLGDDDGEVLDVFSDLARGGVHVAEVGVAVAASRRRADRDEHGVCRGDCVAQIEAEIEPAGGGVAGDQFVEAGLVDRDLTLLQGGDLGGVLVDAGDVMAEVGETRARHQSHISRSDHCNAHTGPDPVSSKPAL